MEKNGWKRVKQTQIRILTAVIFLSVLLLIKPVAADLVTDAHQYFSTLSENVRQAVVVFPQGVDQFKSEVSLWEKKAGQWHLASDVMPAVIGRNSIAWRKEKEEGDGHTPRGIFPLRRAFGYHTKVKTGLNYHRVTEKDLWVDDFESGQYNQWVKSPTNAKSFEILKREDSLYEYVVVVEYNTEPVIPGKGSAIFLHIWRQEQMPTAGCVALEKENVIKILEWLDQDKSPVIILQYRPGDFLPS
jgi:L,D-peptidoglycan transpeptidase YkuD (ErfK/YbiS/YcfS/YnhG family)